MGIVLILYKVTIYVCTYVSKIPMCLCAFQISFKNIFLHKVYNTQQKV